MLFSLVLFFKFQMIVSGRHTLLAPVIYYIYKIPERCKCNYPYIYTNIPLIYKIFKKSMKNLYGRKYQFIWKVPIYMESLYHSPEDCLHGVCVTNLGVIWLDPHNFLLWSHGRLLSMKSLVRVLPAAAYTSNMVPNIWSGWSKPTRSGLRVLSCPG